jgi:Lysylphosphatidylglycerol synthase TM region
VLVSAAEYVEHEGFVTMLAARGGVRVPEVVTAGLADNGDALIVVRHSGVPLGDGSPELTADQERSLWEQLGRLHRPSPDRSRSRRSDGWLAGFSDLSSASVGPTELDALADRAQLLALTMVTSGKDVAIDHAVSALDREGLTAVLPYLQEASLPPLVRAALRGGRIDLDKIRSELAESLGAAEIELSAGVIDSVSEFVVQITLFVLVFFSSDVDLGLSLKTDQLSGVATTALIIIAVLVVAAAIAFAVPSLRQRVLTWLHEARDALQVLRDARKLLQLYGGNLLAQVLFAMTLGACVRAFGYEVPLRTLILINTVVSLFAGLLPVPGGVGVSDAGLSLGLTRAGIPSETAFAIALTYRFVTFYLPPIWGLRRYRWLTSRRYL